VAVSVAQALPPAARGALGAGEPAGLGARGPSHATASAIAAAWRKRAASVLAASPPLDHEPRAGVPEARARAFRDLRERVRAAGGASAPEDLRMRYATVVLEDRVGAALEGARREAAAAPATEAARWAVLGRAVAAVDPGAFEAVVAEVAEIAAKGEEAVEAFRDRHAPGRGGVKQRAQWELVAQIEAKRLLLPPDLRGQAQGLQSALLRSLQVPDERVREFEGESRPSVRMRLLGDLLRERGVPGGVRGLFPGAPGQGPGRGRDGPPRK
jgi:hypothetical protein